MRRQNNAIGKIRQVMVIMISLIMTFSSITFMAFADDSTAGEQNAKAPVIDSVAGLDGSVNTIEDLTPTFSPDVHVYGFTSSRPIGSEREIRLTVDKNVKVAVDGKAVTVSSSGKCTVTIKYKSEDSSNVIRLTDEDNKLSSRYVFHAFGYGVRDNMSGLSLLNAGGSSDSAIGQMSCRGSVYRVSTNLETVKFSWKVSLGENASYLAKLMDEDGNVIDTMNYATGDYPGSKTFLSDEIKLQNGTNHYIIRCYGTYDIWVGGEPVKVKGVHDVMINIVKNDADIEAMRDTTLAGLDIYVNDKSGNNILKNFSPSRREYDVTLAPDEFDSAIRENSIRMTADTDKNILVYGGNGVAQTRTLQKGGYYLLATYYKTELPGTDYFEVKITVTAKDGITRGSYLIRVKKKGRSGMVIPDCYREEEQSITSNQPSRSILLTLGSIAVYDQNGRSQSNIIMNGNLKIRVADENIIKWEGTTTDSSYKMRLIKAGKTKIYLTYDDGISHFEDSINMTVRYSADFLNKKIKEARQLIRSSQAEGRVFGAGAETALKKQIDSSVSVYENCRREKTTTEKDSISSSAEALISAIDRYTRAEEGTMITGFETLSKSVALQTVENGTKLQQLVLPASLRVTIGGKTTTVNGVTWKSDRLYNAREDQFYRYTFTPVMPVGYSVRQGVDYPQIIVERGEPKILITVRRTIPLSAGILKQRVYRGTKKSQLVLPNLKMYVRDDMPWGGTLTVPVRWKDNDGYNGNKTGTYTFTSYLDPDASDYAIGQNPDDDVMQTITVQVVDPPEGTGKGEGNGGSGEGNGGGNGSGAGTGTGNGTGITGTGTGGSGASVTADGAGGNSAATITTGEKTSADASVSGKSETNKASAATEGKNTSDREGGGGGNQSHNKVFEIAGETISRHPLLTAGFLLTVAVLIFLGCMVSYRRQKSQWEEE